MDLRETFQVFRRQWILTSALLLLTLIITAVSALTLHSSYQASATVALLNSATSSQTIGGGNPYLSFDDSLVETANVLVIEASSQQTAAQLRRQGYTASFQATVLAENPETEEPFVQISVSGSSADSVERTVRGVTAELDSLLGQLQAKVSSANRATLQVMAEDNQPSPSASSKIKPLVGFLGLGLVLTFIVPQAVEGVGRRRARSQASAAPEPAAAAGPDTEPLADAAPEEDVSVVPEPAPEPALKPAAEPAPEPATVPAPDQSPRPTRSRKRTRVRRPQPAAVPEPDPGHTPSTEADMAPVPVDMSANGSAKSH